VHDRVQAHAVGGEHALEPDAEAVGRQAAQVGDRLAEARDRAGGVEGGASGVAVEVLLTLVDEIEKRLAADQDEVLGRDGALVRVGRDDGASIRSASVATAPSGYVTAA
jgi:hypothetical protein